MGSLETQNLGNGRIPEVPFIQSHPKLVVLNTYFGVRHTWVFSHLGSLQKLIVATGHRRVTIFIVARLF